MLFNSIPHKPCCTAPNGQLRNALTKANATIHGESMLLLTATAAEMQQAWLDQKLAQPPLCGQTETNPPCTSSMGT